MEPRWAQVIDVEVTRTVTETLLPGVWCPCCGTAAFADPPPGAHAGAVSYGPGLNAAAVVLTAYGNVPPERTARVIGMILGTEVSAGWADKASGRLPAQLGRAGFDEAMLAALAAERVLAADETPVSVPGWGPVPAGAGKADPDDGRPAAAGAAHVMIVRTPDERLTFLQAMGSRRKDAIAAALPAPFTGILVADGYAGYQHLLSRLAGIQQCCQHDARRAAEAARARGAAALDPLALASLEQRYDQAVSFGIIHNRHRDWDSGNHPGYALGTWLRGHKAQVFLFTRDFAVPWTNNVSERGAKAAKRHQAVSGCWHTLRTLARWCQIRSYLDSAAAHGVTPLDAITSAITGKPWLPPLPATG
jgi:transposase